MLDKAKERFEQMKKLKNMRSQAKSLEKQLVQLTYEGKSKNKLVTAIVDGKMSVRSVDISEELVEKKDKKTLEKSVMEAISQAFQDAQKGASEKMKEMGGFPGF